jgi:peptidoglycan/LPS O-acetylase OafA/YrhL
MRLGYRPALDGIRAIAILLVLALHGRLLHGGFLGVDLFFVLSGFLITALLVQEWEGRQTISLRRFYIRRARRLLPALAAAVAGVGLIYVALPHVSRGLGFGLSLAAVAGYAGNWVAAFSSGRPLGLLSHTWSLAIEEQFYIVWPALLVFALRRRCPRALLGMLLLGVAAMSALDRYLTWHGGHLAWAYNRTDAHADGLLLGCATLLLVFHPGARLLRTCLQGIGLPVVVLALLALAVHGLRFDSVAPYEYGIALVNVAAAVLIAHVVLAPGSAIARLLALRPLAWIGARSYGIYLYHFPIFLCVAPQTLHLNKYSFVAVVIPITLVAAAVSYRFIERPFLARTQYPRIAEVSPGAPGSPAPSTPAPTT